MMNIERFVDLYGDDVYALALIVTKDFDSAAKVFSEISAEYEKISENAEIYEIVQKAFPLCRKVKCNENAETLSGLGLPKKQENLISDIFSKPQIARAILHLHYENDLSAEQIEKITGESLRYISEQLSEDSERLEASYKELCQKLTAGDELKAKAISAAKSCGKRMFEAEKEPVPEHSWTKRQKIAAIIFAVIAAVLICIVIPIISAYFASESELDGSSYDEAPSDLIFSYASDAEQPSSESY